MIKTYDDAVACQTRREKKGLKGLAGAVRSWIQANKVRVPYARRLPSKHNQQPPSEG